MRFFLLLMAALPLAAAPPKPDILLIMADDMGWSDIGCYGGEIATPRIDSLAENGLRFTRFYNAARCCPTRAALLTGLYPHQAGVGAMVQGKPSDKDDPYQGYLNDRCVTLAEVLRPAGYSTYLAGKWHVGEFRPVWPVDRGFDRHYGLISGAMNYYNIQKTKSPGAVRKFVDDEKELTPGKDGDFYATDAFTDAALNYLRDQPRDRPFFLYLSYTAPHWPLHAPEDVIRKYEKTYLRDWEELRKERHQRQVELGVIAPGTALSPLDAPNWDSLDEGKQNEMARKMAVYAAMVEVMDTNIGRVLDLLREQGRLDNTLVMFLSDNGACAESHMLGTNMRKDLTGPIGTEDSYHTYGQAWANVSNTPLRRYKKDTHEGGARTPLVVHWPAGLGTEPGSFTDATGHVIDFMPTLRELAGADYPAAREGKKIQPEEGRSLVPVLRGEAGEPRTLGWEHFGSSAWRDGDLKLVRPNKKAAWQLYDLGEDPCELENLASDRSAEIERLSAAYTAWADRVGVR